MRILSLLLLLLIAAPALSQENHKARTEKHMPKLEALYRWFHSNPELSRQEEKTAQRLTSELESLGLDVYPNVGGHGVMALLKSDKPGPTVLYRADMDALPVTEETGLPYASKNSGVMHACGHDIHMTCAVGTLAVMSEIKDQWAGTIVFVGQPAEELGSGAEAMLADPTFQEVLEIAGSPPIAAIALHDFSNVAAGKAVLTPGFITANVDSIDITVRGKGGHGAAPETTVDPVVIGAEIVSALQTIVSRRLPPGTRAVITVGKFEGGTKRNIIPSEARLELTVRSYEEKVRKQIIEEIERVAVGVAAAHNAPEPPVVYHHAKEYTPAGFNDHAMVSQMTPVFQEVLGVETLPQLPPSMVGEDFAEYAKAFKIPSVIFLLGAADPAAVESGAELPALHSSKFAPAYSPTIRTGVNLTVASLLELLRI